MKQGRTLQELAAELERQREAKKDYLAPTRALALVSETGGSDLFMDANQSVGVNELAHGQIASFCDIPKKYYDRLRKEGPRVLDYNVNHWFKNVDRSDQKLIRTLDGHARAFLSDRYRPMDNIDLAEAVLPVLAEMEVQVLSCQVTERNMYLKVVDKSIERDVPTGKKMGDGTHTIFDTLCPAITISNSEVGCGSLAVVGSVFTRACTNLAAFGETAVRKAHLGGRFDAGDSARELWTDETRKVSDQALWMQVRDTVKAAFDEARFEATIKKLADASQQRISGDPAKVVEVTAKKFGMTDTEQGSVLRHLIEGGDLSRYGLHSAITRTGEDIEDYDRATEFERTGGKIIELPKKDWVVLAEAA